MMPLEVRLDNGDGWVRIYDWHREGWVEKKYLVTNEDAPIHWDKVLKANPKDTFALFMRGNGRRQKGEYDNAIADFTECIRLDPSDAQAYNSRGTAWGAKKEYDKAIQDFSEAIRLDAKYAMAFYNRGIAWTYKKEHDTAIQDYSEAIRLDSRHAKAFIGRGWSLYLTRQYDKALVDFDACLKLDSNDALTTGNRGLIFAAQKKYGPAVEAFEAALALKSATYPPYKYAEFLASCPEAKYRDGKRAVDLAKKALEIEGKDASWEAHAALAAAQAEVSDFELAVTAQRTALDDKTCTGDDRKKMEARLELYRAKKPYRAE